MQADLLTKSVTLDASEIAALKDNPVGLISPPGPGMSVALIQVTLVYVAGSAPYADTTATLNVGPEGQPPQFSTGLGGFIDRPVSRVYSTAAGSLDADLAGVENAPVVISTDVEGPAGGDGTLTVTAHYVIVNS